MKTSSYNLAITAVILSALFTSVLLAQRSSIFWIKINDTVGGHDSLVFGFDQRATYCTDSALGENQAPPPPPGFWAVFLGIPGRANCFTSFGLIKKDFRDFSPSRKDTFYIRFQNTDSAADLPNVSVTLRWPVATYLAQGCDSMFIVDPSGSILTTRVNMFVSDSVVLPHVYDPYGTNPSAPVFRFFIYVYGVPRCIPECAYPPPNAFTDSASQLSATSATLNGSAVGNCYNLDSVGFQFGLTPSYGSNVTASQGSGYTVSAFVTNLMPRTRYHYRIVSYLSGNCATPWGLLGGDSMFSTLRPTSVKDNRVNVPQVFSLNQTYPNPFNPTTLISFTIPKYTHVRLQVFNLLGELMETLVNEEKQSGTYIVRWDASTIPSGLYFYRMIAGDFVQTKKTILLR